MSFNVQHKQKHTILNIGKLKLSKQTNNEINAIKVEEVIEYQGEKGNMD